MKLPVFLPPVLATKSFSYKKPFVPLCLHGKNRWEKKGHGGAPSVFEKHCASAPTESAARNQRIMANFSEESTFPFAQTVSRYMPG